MDDRQSMLLDPSIRDWVLFPIMLVMVLVGVLRHHVTSLLNSTPKTSAKKIRESQALLRSRTLRTPKNSSDLPSASFIARKEYYSKAFGQQLYLANPPPPLVDGQPPNPLSDPAGMETMMDGMKKSMAMIIPQTLIMSWITFFFSGFVLIRLPFPLTIRFKSMLQNGIATQDMDVTWVSSLSWYFLNLFGLRSIFTLILGGENSADGVQDMQQLQMMSAPQAQMQPADLVKIFQSEKDFLDILVQENDDKEETVEDRLLRKYSGGNMKKSSEVKKKE